MLADRCFRDKAVAININPDSIYPDGCIAQAMNLFDGGKDVILCAAVRFEMEGVEKELTAAGKMAPGQPIVLPMREATAVGLRNMHPETLASDWDAPNFGRLDPEHHRKHFLTCCFWRVPGQDGVIIVTHNWAPFLVNYGILGSHNTSALDGRALDGNYIFENFPQYTDSIEVVRDSDTLFLLGLTPRDEMVPPNEPPDWREWPVVREWGRGYILNRTVFDPGVDIYRRAIYQSTVRWHARDYDGSWQAVERKVKRLIREYVAKDIDALDAPYTLRNAIRRRWLAAVRPAMFEPKGEALRTKPAPSDLEARIISYDIGGRGFGTALRYPPAFRNDTLHLFFEADVECASAMMRFPKGPKNTLVSAQCLGARKRFAFLNLTRNLHRSSVLNPAPGEGEHEILLSGTDGGVSLDGLLYDSKLGRELQVVRRVPLYVRPLDSLIRNQELPVAAPPDFLFVDTPGTEVDVLNGARVTLHKHVLAFAAATEFHPMYCNQKPFSKIFEMADAASFEFVGFSKLHEVALSSVPVGTRAEEFLRSGNLLFFRTLKSLKEVAPSERWLMIACCKLAFVAVCFNRLGYALALLDELYRHPNSSRLLEELRTYNYIRFLEEMHEVYRSMPHRFLHREQEQLVSDLRSRSPDLVDPNGMTEAMTPITWEPQVLHLENPGVGTVTTPMPSDLGKATHNDGASALGYGFVPEWRDTGIICVRVTANGYSETDNEFALAIFRNGELAPVKFTSTPIAANSYANLALEFELPFDGSAALDIRIGPTRGRHNH